MSTPQRRFFNRMMQGRRSKNIEDRRGQGVPGVSPLDSAGYPDEEERQKGKVPLLGRSIPIPPDGDKSSITRFQSGRDLYVALTAAKNMKPARTLKHTRLPKKRS